MWLSSNYVQYRETSASGIYTSQFFNSLFAPIYNSGYRWVRFIFISSIVNENMWGDKLYLQCLVSQNFVYLPVLSVVSIMLAQMDTVTWDGKKNSWFLFQGCDNHHFSITSMLLAVICGHKYRFTILDAWSSGKLNFWMVTPKILNIIITVVSYIAKCVSV